ncbi:MAG: terpene cyclase/mutase family protein, partial [Sinobacterium sp.]|nr:terpene cyclase/mutase family protein [Sinobacterium sp.]
MSLVKIEGQKVVHELGDLFEVKGYEGLAAPDLSQGFPSDFFQDTISYIKGVQLESGAIPWFDRGHADPWDHVEAAMALSIAGEFDAAEKAYNWLRETQLEDGSWWAAYRGDKIDNQERRETNFVAYVATGIWHHYLISKNTHFAQKMWPCVQAAIGFVLALQTEHGEIHWAVTGNGEPKKDALITGCSSIYKSLECAYNLSCVLDDAKPEWFSARERLGKTLRFRPERFDRTWES